MIKVNELRIGNHVLDEHGNISIINTISRSVRISNDKYKWESKGEEQIHPIPLTDELLLECGFENYEVFKNTWGYNGIELYIQDGIIWIDLMNNSVEINYLHELQNLYFSLTKTELKIENYEKTNTKT
jgi:hypothetical protein